MGLPKGRCRYQSLAASVNCQVRGPITYSMLVSRDPWMESALRRREKWAEGISLVHQLAMKRSAQPPQRPSRPTTHVRESFAQTRDDPRANITRDDAFRSGKATLQLREGFWQGFFQLDSALKCLLQCHDGFKRVRLRSGFRIVWLCFVQCLPASYLRGPNHCPGAEREESAEACTCLPHGFAHRDRTSCNLGWLTNSAPGLRSSARPGTEFGFDKAISV